MTTLAAAADTHADTASADELEEAAKKATPSEAEKPDTDTAETPEESKKPETSVQPDETEDETENAEHATSSEAVKPRVKRVQKLIDALPAAEDVTKDNLSSVQKKLDAIERAMASLSDEELADLDVADYDAVKAAVEALTAPTMMPAAATLAAPGNPRWDESEVGKATWDAVDGAVGYKIGLYMIPGHHQVGELIDLPAGTTTYTFEISNILPHYVFQVYAVGSDGKLSPDAESNSTSFDEATSKKVTVTFYTTPDSGETLSKQTIERGSKLTEPQMPDVPEGYTFLGWSRDDGATFWNFNDPVEADMFLYPVWQLNIAAPEAIMYSRSSVGAIKWTAVEGASAYIVQLYDEKGNQMGSSVKVGSDTTIYDFKITDTSHAYQFGVRAINQDGLAGPETRTAPISYLPTPTSLRWTSTRVPSVRWNPVEGAVGYLIQLYNATGPGGIGSPESELIEIRGKNTTSYTFTIDNTNTLYAFSVRAISDDNTPYTGYSLTAFSDMRGFDQANSEFVDIKFDANGGGLAGGVLPPAGIHTRNGSRISPPDGVTRPGYRLVGWRYNPSQLWDFNDPVTTSMTLVAVWAKNDVSANTNVSSVSVSGVRASGSSSSGIFRVTLPKGSKYKDDPSTVSIRTSDSSAKVLNLRTTNGGRTWYFTVRAADGWTEKNYTINVSISSSSGGGGGGSSSGGGGGGGGSSSGGGSFSGSGVNTFGGPGAASQSLAPNGNWESDANGWKFKTTAGAYPTDNWYECVWNNAKNWYHFDANGYLNSGWFTDKDGQTYYLHDAHDNGFGYMYTGWHWIGGKCYYFNPVSGTNGLVKGVLFKNTTTPDGYTVDATGAWTVNGVVQTQPQAAQQTAASAQASALSGDFEGFKNDFLQGIAPTVWNGSIERDASGNVTINVTAKDGGLKLKDLQSLKTAKANNFYPNSVLKDYVKAVKEFSNSWDQLGAAFQQLAALNYQKFQKFGLSGTVTYNLLTNDTKTVVLTYQNGVQTFDYTD